ncbi:hypothetical protein BGE01nite_49880 [Brevifollis gellanilyticus]|uniref:Uncharacterized protein n=2 Tax=Brevifollis gellanilyticus TaxID=748831 RepID=A0A512MG34_9BACT|nr:hypothetical protein BGE01nite_49880 [Brevifollis gellanilyticus]
MLQFAGRTSRVKHKALLMAPTPPTDSIPFKAEVSHEASNFPGDAFERMCLDPELIRTRRQFMVGAVCVVALVIGLAVMHFTSPRSQPEETSADVAESPASASVMAKTEAAVQSQPRPVASAVPAPAGPSHAASPSSPMRITFRSATDTTPRPADESQGALESFLKAPTVDEKLALVHDAVRVEPAMRAYYQKHQVGALSYSHVERHPQSLRSDFAEFRVVLTDGTRKFAAVMTTPEGPRVDWASFVALGDLEWEQMRQTRPTKPVLMRVLAFAGDHFSGSFSDARTLSCVRFVPAENPTAAPVYGYVPTTSDLGRQIATWLSSSGSDPLPLTVKLSYPEKAVSHDQAWIAEVVVPGWVTLVSPPTTGEGE